MGIIRVKKDDHYFTASNESFQDHRLLWETRGLLGYLFSKPNNWEVRAADLIKQGPAGEHKIRRMLANARQFGYMNRIRITNPDGTFDWETEVFESPSLNPNPSTRRFSTSGSATSGKVPDVLKTELTSTDRERFAEVAKAVSELQGGGLKPTDADLITEWLTKHEDKYIFNAIAIARGQGARSSKYVDNVLIGWEANGYPLSRDQKVQNAKKPAGAGNSNAEALRKAREAQGTPQ